MLIFSKSGRKTGRLLQYRINFAIENKNTEDYD